MIKAFLFDAKGKDRELGEDLRKLPKLRKDQLLWFHLNRRIPDELERLRILLRLQMETVGELRLSSQASTLDSYDHYFHCSVVAVSSADRQDSGLPVLSKGVRLDFVVGHEWLVTIADEDLPFINEFRDRDRGETIIGVLSSASLAASLLDWHLTSYHSRLEALESSLEAMDVKLLAGRSISNGFLKQLVAARRYVAQLRRNLAPQRTVFYGLSRPDFALVTKADAREPYRALERRFERVLDSIEHSRELVQGSFDLFETRIAESTNILVRRLTFLSIMLGGIGAVAGIFGMNFQTAFTSSGELGFWIVIGALFVAAMLALTISRLKQWI